MRSFAKTSARLIQYVFFSFAIFSLAIGQNAQADLAHEYVLLAAAPYNLGSAPQGYNVIAQKKDPTSGFQGVALLDGSGRSVVIAFAGTQTSDFNDILADVGISKAEMGQVEIMLAKIIASKLPQMTAKLAAELAQSNHKLKPVAPNAKLLAQLDTANKFFDEVALTHRGKNIVITGHSLGGYLAQSVASRTGVQAVTFNAPGASALKKGENTNITNYMREHDVVGMFGSHIGPVIKFPDVHPNLDPRDRYVIRNHSIQQFATNLSQGLTPLK